MSILQSIRFVLICTYEADVVNAVVGKVCSSMLTLGSEFHEFVCR